MVESESIDWEKKVFLGFCGCWNRLRLVVMRDFKDEEQIFFQELKLGILLEGFRGIGYYKMVNFVYFVVGFVFRWF